jgi:isochorismate hydrolase
MDQDYILTEKANFPEDDATAMAELAVAVGLVMDFMDGFVRMANEKEPETMNLWGVGRGLQAASELYFIQRARNE